MFDNALQDLRSALNSLSRSAAFSATAVTILALGIGASTAIFSVVHGVLLSPMPLHEPDQLVWLWSSNQGQKALYERTSEANLVDWRERQTKFEALVAGQNRAWTWTDPEQAKKLSVVVTTADFFEVLGAQPAAGRLIESSDEDQQVVVLTHHFWQREFDADPNVVGQHLALEGASYEVLGVLPATFGLPRDTADIFVQRRLRSGAIRHMRVFWVLGRLKQGVPLAAAQSEMTSLAEDLGREHPKTNTGWGITVSPLQEHLVSAVRPGLWTLFGAMSLVLLIACANVANLLLARATTRDQEIGVRLSLGASRWRIARALLFESLVLALAGAALGVFLARSALPVLLHFYPNTLPRAGEIGIDGRVLAFALAAAMLTSLICGLVPAFKSSRRDLMDTLRGANLGSSDRKRSFRKALVVTEIALALMLLVGAGLLMKSFSTLYRIDPGFSTERMAVVRMFLRPQNMSPSERIDFFGRLGEHLASVPGVESAGGSSVIPLSRIRMERTASFSTAGSSETAQEAPQAEIRISTHGYLPTLGAPLSSGRFFNAHDRHDTAPVAVINASLAHLVWPEENPVGRRLSVAFGSKWVEREIVGVVGDVRYRDLTDELRPAIYVPHTQIPSTLGMQFVVRTTAAPTALLPSLEREVLAFNPLLPAHSLTTLDTILVESLAKERFATILMGLFAAMAALLAAVGIYAMLAYAVGRRTREIGIRMAVGARPQQVFSLILRQALSLTGLGILVGLAAALFSGRLLESQLYGVSPLDPLTLAVVVATLVAVSHLAAWLPARRAMKVDPLRALHHD